MLWANTHRTCMRRALRSRQPNRASEHGAQEITMTNRQIVTFAVAATMCGTSMATAVPGQGTWETTLQDRDLNGDGVTDAFYDTTRSITWLRDARQAEYVDWGTANLWVNNLSFGGYSDWRLPNALDADGRLCQGYRCTGSEIGNLWLTVLGNLDETVFNGNAASHNSGDFVNLGGYYWTSSSEPYWQIYFQTFQGYQSSAQDNVLMHVMAVRSGDVAASVPVPQTLALVLTALCGLAVVRRRAAG